MAEISCKNMRIIVRRSKFTLNPDQFLKKAGYAVVISRKSDQVSYSRRLAGGLYPRFHLYYTEDGEAITFNIHLDQQKTASSYSGSRHKGEYDGGIVREEVSRLKQLMVQLLKNNS